MTPFIGAHNLFSVGYYGQLVEALTECIFDHGSRRGGVTIDPTMDIAQQPLPLFNGDAALHDLGVALLVEFALNKDKGPGVMGELLSFHLVHR